MLVRAFTVVSLSCLPATLVGQGRFEGVITAHLSTAQAGGADVTYSIKGDQFRMDIAGMGGRGSMAMLHDATKGTTYMVMSAQKMYMDVTNTASRAAPEAERKAAAASIKMTGKKETIAGVECEHVLITGDDGQYDACIAKGMGTFTMMSNPMGGRSNAPPGWSEKLGRDAFPLKVQKVGGELAFEVTKIEKKSLDASLFTVPSDFQKLDMGGRFGRPPL